jgi:C-terminal processing protease CtpA/Prc
MRKLIGILCLLSYAPIFAQMPTTLSRADKIYGLSKFWQEVNYNFVYLDKIDRQQWDSTYHTMIEAVCNTTDDYTYYRLLLKFCATLHDGHTNVWMPGTVGSQVFTKMFGKYWFGTENIGGKAIVTRILRSEMNEIPIGSEVIEVNGLSMTQYIADSVKPYISSSTDYVREDEAIANLLQGPIGASYKVKIKRPDGSILPLDLVHARTQDTAFYPAFENHPLLELKWYDGDIAYLALNSFGDIKIDSLFFARLPELYKARGLIIDLRNNGGGSTNIGTEILQYLMEDSVMPHSRYFTREHRGAFKAWGKYVEPKDTVFSDWNRRAWHDYHDNFMYAFDYSPDTIPASRLRHRKLVVPTVLLIGHNTASAAEDFLISASEQKHMIRVGANSFGSTGQPFLFDLPGGGGARVCTKKDTYPDGREFVGHGVVPDIYVEPTVRDYIEHKDPALDKGLEWVRKKASSSEPRAASR